jgi:endonuclease/exonuclease/phosphatase family metal-dependent hydrolase
MEVKILSWNIWIEGRFSEVCDFLKSSDADIIGLQEVESHKSDRDIIVFLEGLGYKHAFAPIEKMIERQGKVTRWNDGPAIFSKYDILKSETFVLSEQDPRGAVRADIQVGNSVLHVFSTHLLHTHQQPSATQELQAENLIKLLTAERTILMGDFNATPESAIIQKAETVLINTDPSNTPTWSVYPEGCLVCKPQAIDTRLDYIFTTPDLKTSSFKVEGSKASDHLPISVIVEV